MPSINERAHSAADPTASESLLRELAKDKAPKVREAVAANPQAPAGVLRALADDSNWRVRDAVASNPSPAGWPQPFPPRTMARGVAQFSVRTWTTRPVSPYRQIRTIECAKQSRA